MENKKEYFLNLVEDSVADLFYYNRKNDEFTREDVDEIIDNQEISLEEILLRFQNTITSNFPGIKRET